MRLCCQGSTAIQITEHAFHFSIHYFKVKDTFTTQGVEFSRKEDENILLRNLLLLLKKSGNEKPNYITQHMCRTMNMVNHLNQVQLNFFVSRINVKFEIFLSITQMKWHKTFLFLIPFTSGILGCLLLTCVFNQYAKTNNKNLIFLNLFIIARVRYLLILF